MSNRFQTTTDARAGRSLAAWIVACVGALGVSARPGPAALPDDPAGQADYREKAALLHKVQKYVEWPAERLPEGAPFVIGVYGLDPFRELLDETFAGRGHDGHPFELLRQWHLDGLERCHVLFVPATEKAALPLIAERVAGKSVLLIGESEGFASRGGVVNFLGSAEERLTIEINVDAAKRERLTIRSNLLKLARIVHDRKEVQS